MPQFKPTVSPSDPPFNTSINLDADIYEWIVYEMKQRDTTRSKAINLVLRERMEQRPSGFIHDIRWIYENQDQFQIKDTSYNKDWFVGGFTVSLGKDPAELLPPFAKILVAENTRDDLMLLFAEAVVDQSQSGLPLVLVIPYKLDKGHKVWTTLDKQRLIHVVTPENLLKVLTDLSKED